MPDLISEILKADILKVTAKSYICHCIILYEINPFSLHFGGKLSPTYIKEWDEGLSAHGSQSHTLVQNLGQVG